MPLNVLDAHYESFEKNVLPVLLERNIGVIGMKPMADGRIVYGGLAGAEECLSYAMSLPASVVLTGCDSLERVEQALRVARGFAPLDRDRVNALLARTAGRSTGREERALQDARAVRRDDPEPLLARVERAAASSAASCPGRSRTVYVRRPFRVAVPRARCPPGAPGA